MAMMSKSVRTSWWLKLHEFTVLIFVYFLFRRPVLTLSQAIPLRLYTLPYWSNPPFLICDIRALWRSGVSARVPECHKLKMLG